MLGIHIRDPTIDYDVDYIQFFVIGPQNYTTVEWLNTREKRAEFAKDPRIKIVHGSYVDHPWNGDKLAIYNIKREFMLAEEIGAKYLIIHIISDVNKIEAHIDKILERKPDSVNLALEIDAKGEWTPSEINPIMDIIHRYKIKLCLDTAHLWSSGINIRTKEDVKLWFENVRHIEDIAIIHLNDDKNPIGTKYDRHDYLLPGEGAIWKTTDSGLREILKNNCIFILERHDYGKIKEEIQYIKKLMN